MEKKSQASVITVVVLILVVLAAIVIVYAVVINVIKGSASDVDSEIMSVQLEIEKDSVYIDYDTDKVAQIKVSRGPDKANVSSIKIVALGKDLEGKDKTYVEVRTIEIPQPLEYRIYVLDLEIADFKKDSITKITVYPVSPNGKIGIGYAHTVKKIEQGNTPSGGFSRGDEETGKTEKKNPVPIECVECPRGNAWCNGADITRDNKVDANDYDVIDKWILFHKEEACFVGLNYCIDGECVECLDNSDCLTRQECNSHACIESVV